MSNFDFKADKDLFKILIKVGKKMHKSPWSACAITEEAVYQALNREGNYPQACMEETILFHWTEDLTEIAYSNNDEKIIKVNKFLEKLKDE